ncbi:uncharacterized protein LOC130736496 [Lotus japonicus]|uniref:uncharacterized protein LOC130736496 n=1 Tax=Lotus japonicus TaxID=34305 RepID=UPI00258D9244|nr:uncharacterized protein LOC130736496 [Lotus japonicus]
MAKEMAIDEVDVSILPVEMILQEEATTNKDNTRLEEDEEGVEEFEDLRNLRLDCIYDDSPLELITTDQGIVFVGRKVAAFAESWGIKLLTSTPYYAQANGQVEAANKILISLIKKHVGRKPKSWHESLSQVLWAYRNSPREATGTTPFQLAYGQEAVLPAEVYLQSCRIERQEEIPSEVYWNMMLDELVNLDEERISAQDVLTRQKDRIAKAYNKKVKDRSFVTGDYVWKVILPMDKKDRAYGKWTPNWEGPFKVEKTLPNNAYVIKELSNQRQCVTVNGKYLKAYKPMLHEIKIE